MLAAGRPSGPQTSSRMFSPKARGFSARESSVPRAEDLGRELRINLGQLRCNDLAQEPERLGSGRRRFRHVVRPVKIESRLFQDLLGRMTRVHAGQRKASVCEAEQPTVGHQRDRPGWAIHIGFAYTWRADEVDLRHQGSARMFGAEKDHFRHDIVEVGGPERAGEAYCRSLVFAGAHQLDVAVAVYLPT